jgi:integron integrase
MSDKKLLEQVRDKIRVKHYSYRTEQSYVQWIKRFIIFHNKQHPKDMGEKEINEYLTFLAVKSKVAASTQNQALNAIIFLYRDVLKHNIGDLGNFERAKKSEKIPTVLTREETASIFKYLNYEYKLMAGLLYGSGLRLKECIRLRVKDVDINLNQIVVREGKGYKDRVTMLPHKFKDNLKLQIKKVRLIHQQDLLEGFGEVYLPFALEKKYKNANKEFGWQYVFPALKRSQDPRSGKIRRHHISESILQKEVKKAVRAAKIIKPASCHTLRHSFVA